ncbi:hypothetical protein [Streptomyces sp. NPDC048357]|uniref:hypothetical protein n=1 Tax=Streptomyces sp. NPDC048357 TaxID=3154719 RepID=UPI0034182C35
MFSQRGLRIDVRVRELPLVLLGAGGAALASSAGVPAELVAPVALLVALQLSFKRL